MRGAACCARLILGIGVCLALATSSGAAIVSLSWQLRSNINATVNAGDTVIWQWGDDFPHTLQQTGAMNPTIFTGRGTGNCDPGNYKTPPFQYAIQVNHTGRYTYNDGCNPMTTLGILWVLPLPLLGPVPPPTVTVYNTTNSPPLYNSNTLILSPPPPAAPAPAPAPAPPVGTPVIVLLNTSNISAATGGAIDAGALPPTIPLSGVIVTKPNGMTNSTNGVGVVRVGGYLVGVGLLASVLALLS